MIHLSHEDFVKTFVTEWTTIINFGWDEFIKKKELSFNKVVNSSDFVSNFKLFADFFILKKI